MEQTSKTLKTLLGILLVILLATFVFVLTRKNDVQAPVITDTPVTTNQDQSEGTPVVSPAVLEKAAKEANAVQDQVKAGTLSAEEAKKQLDAIGAKIPTPPLPPEVKK